MNSCLGHSSLGRVSLISRAVNFDLILPIIPSVRIVSLAEDSPTRRGELLLMAESEEQEI